MRNLPVLLAFPVLLLSGCDPQRPETVPVSGKVTFDGQPPPAAGLLYFAPLEPAEGFPRRGGQAAFDTSGVYAATSYMAGDGLLPGKYRARIECWREPADEASGRPGVSHVPAGFTLPDLEVPAGSRPLKVDFNVPPIAG